MVPVSQNLLAFLRMLVQNQHHQVIVSLRRIFACSLKLLLPYAAFSIFRATIRPRGKH